MTSEIVASSSVLQQCSAMRARSKDWAVCYPVDCSCGAFPQEGYHALVSGATSQASK